jgi:hypothetical protein
MLEDRGTIQIVLKTECVVAVWQRRLAECSVKRYKRIGPFVCSSVGALCYLVGFFGLHLAATHQIRAPMWLLCALAYLASNGGTWIEAAAVATCVRNFETERGAVVGILKSFLGLSASVYATLYMTLCTSPLQFLRLLAVVPTAVALIASLGVNLVPFRQFEPHSKEHAFHMSMNATLSLAAYQLVTAMYFKHHSGPDRDYDVVLFPSTSLLWSDVLVVEFAAVPPWELPPPTLPCTGWAAGLLMPTTCLHVSSKMMCDDICMHVQGWTMCMAAACLLMPILTLPAVFGGLRAIPIQSQKPAHLHTRSLTPPLITDTAAGGNAMAADGSSQVCHSVSLDPLQACVSSSNPFLSFHFFSDVFLACSQ